MNVFKKIEGDIMDMHRFLHIRRASSETKALKNILSLMWPHHDGIKSKI